MIGAPNGQLLLINKLNTAPRQSVSKLIRTNNNIANRLRMVDLVTRDEKATNETARKFRKTAWKLNIPSNWVYSTGTALGHSNVYMAGEIYFSFRLSIRSVTFWNNFLQSTATVLQYKKKCTHWRMQKQWTDENFRKSAFGAFSKIYC